LFLGLIALKDIRHFKQLIIVGLSYFYALLLGLYYLAPMALFQKYLPISDTFDNFSIASWLTSLPALLSFKALSPMPLPGNNLLGLPNLYFSVGLPILLGVGGIIYILGQSPRLNNKNVESIIIPLLLLFFLAFFITWSPINFWIYLPKFLKSAQFSYRLLTQVTWIGCILFAIFISWTFHNKLDIRHGFVGLILIILCASTWVPTQSSEKTVKETIANPDIGNGKYAYITMPAAVGAHAKQPILSLANTINNCRWSGKRTICDFTVTNNNMIVQLPILYYPKMLNISVNNQKARYLPTIYKYSDTVIYTLVGLQLAPGHYTVTSYFQGLVFANWISGLAWLLILLVILTKLAMQLIKTILVNYRFKMLNNNLLIKNTHKDGV
jgi:hypothetical protein